MNILYLTGSFYMLEVYDRILPSRSIPSLVAISILALALYAFQGAFDLLRARMMVRIAGVVDQAMTADIFRTIVMQPPHAGKLGERLQTVNDADHVRSYLSGNGPLALFDLPWIPFYIAICFLFHPAIGYLAIGGVLILAGMTYATHRGTRRLSADAVASGTERGRFVQASLRNAEVVQSLGMIDRLVRSWQERSSLHNSQHSTVSDVANGYSAVSKVFRMSLQSAVLGMGAYLVIVGEASGGIIIAGSILTSRALAPAEAAIANWRAMLSASQSWRRISGLLKQQPQRQIDLRLPRPARDLSVEHLWGGAPEASRSVVADINFRVEAGSALAVIGPSASGKSTLARLLIGVWKPHRGAVRLDGAALDQWDSVSLGSQVGYLPQDVELFSGTVAANISRFEPDAPSAAVIAAAQAAGVHELIVRLEKGYETEIGEGGLFLSAGQRQRVALARALYGDPFLIVLDEPNSNLDAEGEEALNRAIGAVRARGGVAVIIAHRPSVLVGVDLVLVLDGGRAAAFGPKEKVLGGVARPKFATAAGERPAPLKVVGDDEATAS